MSDEPLDMLLIGCSCEVYRQRVAQGSSVPPAAIADLAAVGVMEQQIAAPAAPAPAPPGTSCLNPAILSAPRVLQGDDLMDLLGGPSVPAASQPVPAPAAVNIPHSKPHSQ